MYSKKYFISFKKIRKKKEKEITIHFLKNHCIISRIKIPNKIYEKR